MADTTDVIVAGGGLIGASIAREMRRRGLHVTVVEAGGLHGTASRAAAGMLSPFSEVAGIDPAFETLAAASLDRFPAFARELAEESGVPVEYRSAGKLQLAFTEGEAAHLRGRADAGDAARYGVEWLAGDALRALEPALSSRVLGGLRIDRDASVDNRALVDAAVTAARGAGVHWLEGARVAAITLDSASNPSRSTGVLLESGTRLAAEVVVIAAGCWSGRIAGLPAALPVRPVRGQMMAVRLPGPFLEHVIMTAQCYLVPRGDGRLLIGATLEEAGFAVGPTPGGLATLALAAAEAAPRSASLPITESWAGYRPGTPDGRPLLGWHPHVANLLLATGHYRNGILLAPITAEIIAALATDTPPPVPIDAFSLARFDQDTHG
jgi:glycine oxidase